MVDLVAARRLGFVIDLGIEVAEALKVVAQAAVAFVEQVLVDASFLKDGDEPFDALRVNAGALDVDFHHRSAVGGKAEVDGFRRRIVRRGFELDLSLQAILFLKRAKHTIEGSIDGVVVQVGAGAQMGMAAECFQVHPGIAIDRNRANACPRPRDHVKRNVGELLVRVGRHRLRDGRFVIAILLERGAHLCNGAKHPGLSQAGSGFKLAGALQLGVHGGSGGSVHAHDSDESPRGSKKNQRHAARLARSLDLDCVKDSGRVKLAQAPFQVIGAEGCSFRLSEMSWKRGEPVGRDALERDAPHRQTLPRQNGIVCRTRSRGFWRINRRRGT